MQGSCTRLRQLSCNFRPLRRALTRPPPLPHTTARNIAKKAYTGGTNGPVDFLKPQPCDIYINQGSEKCGKPRVPSECRGGC